MDDGQPRFAWWVKAVAIVVTSVFFVEVFYATKGLLGWPGTEKLPQHFQLLWARMVEPDAVPLADAVRNKHFQRKHGPQAYYGQPS